MISEALVYAAFMYEGQIDNFGQLRIFHALRVMETVRAQGASEHVIAAAVLHDVIEHGDADFEDLVIAFGAEVAQMVAMVSRKEGEPVERFDSRCASSPETLLIRRADLHDKISQLPVSPDEDSDLQKAHREKAMNSLMRLPAA